MKFNRYGIAKAYIPKRSGIDMSYIGAFIGLAIGIGIGTEILSRVDSAVQ